jgi:integrase
MELPLCSLLVDTPAGLRRARRSVDATFHQVRHGFASRAAHRGVPINVVSEVMGHSDVGVTQRVYVHLYGREQAEERFRQAMSG